jgi:hypothetical protein
VLAASHLGCACALCLRQVANYLHWFLSVEWGDPAFGARFQFAHNMFRENQLRTPAGERVGAISSALAFCFPFRRSRPLDPPPCTLHQHPRSGSRTRLQHASSPPAPPARAPRPTLSSVPVRSDWLVLQPCERVSGAFSKHTSWTTSIRTNCLTARRRAARGGAGVGGHPAAERADGSAVLHRGRHRTGEG